MNDDTTPPRATLIERRKSIMVIDDEDAVRVALDRILRAHGHHVTLAVCGEDALIKLRAGYVPDLIFVDLLMPRMTGDVFIAEVRKFHPWSEIPIVVISALEAANPPPWLARLDKPFGIHDVLDAVTRYAK